MSTLDDETLNRQDKLKKLIISQGRIIYGPTHPSGHTFDVITDSQKTSQYHCESSASLVVYTRPNSFADWKILCMGQNTPYGTERAMGDLLDSLQHVSEAAGEKLKVGMEIEGNRD
ncbi:hypothetical protein K491DRAFT_717185 [Lophiostoma macrostomum CBS 122681]|uniref:Uncharacterized protein n=1 Tax=Lophiostoma macrostomum CBS 122681 TaxID=1314788 RepID=A0A6A6T2X0_9PLEO|nr:hypothetical protein K491DRAFT_717185 [Lophiostoma macrostomum CBS 122681]